MNEPRVMRYVEIGDRYACIEFKAGPDTTAVSKPISTMPEWLKSIVLVAKMGKHIIVPVTRPPDVVIWFTVDDDYNLESFINLSDEYNQTVR